MVSLENKYNVLRSLQILGVKREDSVTCEKIGKILASSSSPLKDVFYAAKVGQVLQCSVTEADVKVRFATMKSIEFCFQ